MDEICSKVVDYYLGSDRFNGSRIKDSWDRSEIRSHIEAGIIEIVGPGIFPNPHIKPFSKIPIARQIAEYDSNADDCCLYPGRPILEEVVKDKDYEGRPYINTA